MERALIPSALVAWAAGAMVALLGASGFLTVTGVAALDAIVVAAVTYLITCRVGRVHTPVASSGR